jgi:hypothetical protein
VLAGHLGAAPPTLAGQGPALAGLVADALAKDPQARPRDAAGFLQRLEDGAQERYGAGWLDRASIAGLVGAAMAGAGMGAGALGSTAGGGPAAAGSGAGADVPVFVQSGVSTGANARRSFWLSRRAVTAGGVVGAAVVGTGIWVAVASGGGDKSGGRLAADPTPGVSVSASLPGPVSSAPGSIAALNSVPLTGKYKIETVVVSSNYESDPVGTRLSAIWQLDLSCTATACRGTAGSSSGSQFKVTFDGQNLTGRTHGVDVSPCVYTSGPKKGKPDPSTRFRRTGTTNFRFTVTRRSSGPTPAAGTALILSGTWKTRSPKGHVVKGRCSNIDHPRHELQKVTLTYVPE